MQIKRLILLLLFVLLPVHLLGEALAKLNTIDNDAPIILQGQYQADKIIKVKIYNTKYAGDAYFAFLMTDEAGKYQLTQADIDITRIKDGELVFEVSTNEEQKSQNIKTFHLILDKGLMLTLSSRSATELKDDGYINSYEVYDYEVYGETETNIKEFTLIISDENGTTIKYTLADLNIDENGVYHIKDIDLSSLQDGNITFHASGVDIAGNKAQVSHSVIKDTFVAKPVLLKVIKNNNLSNVVNKKILVASGKAEPNAKIFFNFSQGEVFLEESIVANDAGEWELLGGDLDISVFENADVDVSVYQADVARNKSEPLTYINQKFKRPIFPLLPIAIDPQKYQLIYTIVGCNDEIKDIVITKKEIFVATYGFIKVWGKSYAKLQREVELKEVWVNTLIVHQGKVFAGLGNGEIKVYDETSLELLQTIKADILPILSLKISKDKLISSSASGVIKVWSTTSYENIATIKSHQWDVDAIFVSEGKLYSGSDDYSIKIFNLSTMKLIKSIKAAHSGTINDIIVYDHMLISASDDKTIEVRDAQSGKLLRVLRGHKKAVNRLSITNDFLISVSSDRSMILWNMHTGEQYKKIKAHSKKIDALEVNDYNIVTGSRDKKIKIWGYDDSVEALDDEDETKKQKYSLLKSLDVKNGLPTSLSQNENNIIITTDNGYIFFYNKITHDYERKYTTLDEIVKPVVQDKDGASKEDEADNEDEEETDDGEREFIPVMQKINDSENYGNKLLCGLNDSSIKVWDLETNKAVALLTGNESAILDIKISPINILSASAKGNIGVYDIENGSFVNLIEGHQYNINSIALYEDDKVVSAGDDYSIKIRDIESGDLILDIKEAHDDIITKVLVFENYLLSASMDGTIKVRNILNGKLLKVLDAHKAGVTSMVLDEDTLISASEDKTLIAWSMKDFHLIKVMDKHKAAVVDIMITDDYLISIAKDKTIKVWKYYE